MDSISTYLSELLNYIPKPVIMAVLIVIIVTEVTKDAVSKLEYYLEARKGKQIKIFDHTKVIFVIFWSLLSAVILASAKVFTWTMMPLYFIGIYGASTMLYEAVLKRIKNFMEQK